MKGLILAIALISVFHLSHQQGGECQLSLIKSPVGKCPDKDGETPVYLPDDKDPHTFYECSGGTPCPKSCPNNLCWDTSLQPEPGCNFCADSVSFFDAAGTCPPRDGNDTIYLPDTTNCTIYYVCSNGKPIPLHCPETMVFDPTKNVCVESVDYECTTGKLVSPKEVDGTCPAVDPPIPVFFPDTKSCKIYYECSNGEPIQNSCADGLEWNAAKKTCTEPQDSGCTLEDHSTGTAPPVTTESSEEPTATPTEPSTEEPTDSPTTSGRFLKIKNL